MEDDYLHDDGMQALQIKFMVMTALHEMGVTPEEYAAFVNDDKLLSHMKKAFDSMPDGLLGFDDDLYDEAVAPQEVHPIDDADKKSLRLKVQMKYVSKPPMWREIVIPADFNFDQLNHAVQAVMGFDNSHLWQFQDQEYQPNIQIAIPADKSGGYGVEDYTHDACLTPVSAFLAKKGDKLEYTYDFGDDWVFAISVLEVMQRHGEVAECTKWKCDFQPIEDCGGVGSYLEIRKDFSNPDDPAPKEKDQLADYFGFEVFSDLKNWVKDAMFNLEHVNKRLAKIHATRLKK